MRRRELNKIPVTFTVRRSFDYGSRRKSTAPAGMFELVDALGRLVAASLCTEPLDYLLVSRL